MSDNEAGKPKQRRVLLRIKQVLILIVAVWVFVGFPALIFLPTNDHGDQQWVRCQVDSATAEHDTDDDSWQVVLESPDCPVMFIADGVEDANAHRIASATVPGFYELRVYKSVVKADGVVVGQPPVEVHAHMLVRTMR